MPRSQDDVSDPEQELRQRLIDRQAAQQPDPTTDPGGSSDAGSPTFSPAPPAPFEQSPQPAAQPAPQPAPTMAQPSDQINPNVRGYDMGPGGITGTPPTGVSQPNDPQNRAGVPGNTNSPEYLRAWIANVMRGAGKEPTGPGTGPTDLEYYVGRIQAEGGLGTGYDWAGRIQRGLNGTQPPLPSPRSPGPSGAPSQGTVQAMAQPSAFQSYGLQAPQGIWSPDFVNQLRALIQQRLTSASQPVDPNDPTITGTVNAARDEATRASETERAQLAERLYAQGGLNTDQLTQQVQQSGEKTALGLGSLKAQLIQREVQSRRTELQSVMQMALAAGDSQMAREIQMQIAQLDAMLREEGMGIDLAKFTADLNQKAALAGLQG